MIVNDINSCCWCSKIINENKLVIKRLTRFHRRIVPTEKISTPHFSKNDLKLFHRDLSLVFIVYFVILAYIELWKIDHNSLCNEYTICQVISLNVNLVEIINLIHSRCCNVHKIVLRNYLGNIKTNIGLPSIRECDI